MPEIIGRGAEAVLKKKEFMDSYCVVKERLEKGYRVKELDEKLRKERTKEEAKLLSGARRVGVSTPQVYEKQENFLKIGFIDGEKVRNLLPEYDEERRKEVAEEIGEYAAKLHNRGIVHGDLTTSNMIVMDGELYFIDFGLGYFSKSIEDKAVDLYLLWEVLDSTHPDYRDGVWEAVVSGYEDVSEDSDRVLKRVDNIAKRGRYVSDR
ncbi:MAG: KEOPS complex kinase/ATPase Bud32 [Candidatus Aenigmatarchaeota archaeon]